MGNFWRGWQRTSVGDWLGLYGVSCADIEKENVSVRAPYLLTAPVVDTVDG